MTEFTGELGEYGKTAQEALDKLKGILPYEEGNQAYKSLEISVKRDVNREGYEYLAVANYSLKGKEKPITQSTGTGAFTSKLEVIASEREKNI